MRLSCTSPGSCHTCVRWKVRHCNLSWRLLLFSFSSPTLHELSLSLLELLSLLDNFKSMATLVDTDFEVVWFSDWHPSDVIYCICVNRYTATVTVVFHGKETAFRRTKNAAMMEHSNPIMYEVYADNCDVINLRAEVSEELLRPRKDSGQTIIDEVRQRVDTIGNELNGGVRYHLSVAGHSFGGALATVAGFYLAADSIRSLKLASAVKVYTFGSSRVGCEKFQQSFRHLENTGRLQHARFTNSNEFKGPFWDLHRSWSFDNWYKHVGMNIRLNANSAQSLDITYNQGAGMFAEMSSLVESYLCRSTGNAGISEYQQRLHSSREYLACQRGAGKYHFIRLNEDKPLLFLTPLQFIDKRQANAATRRQSVRYL